MHQASALNARQNTTFSCLGMEVYIMHTYMSYICTLISLLSSKLYSRYLGSATGILFYYIGTYHETWEGRVVEQGLRHETRDSENQLDLC